MSVATEITRIQNAKASLKTSINAKTDSQHQITDETIDNYAGFVDSIQAGGNLQNKSVTITTNNTTTTITADSGYDGLDEVEVTTSVSTSTPQITNGAYLFYNGARIDSFNDLMACLTNLTDCAYMFYNAKRTNTNVVLTNGELNALTNMHSFQHMFDYSNFLSVTLSSTSQELRGTYYMFANNPYLTSVDLSGTTVNGSTLVTSTGANNMFQYCTSLQTVKMPTNIFNDASKYTGFTYCFQQCKNLQTINGNSLQYFMEHFPLTHIPSGFFYGSSTNKMTNVVFTTLPDTLTGYIDGNAFAFCPNIIHFSANNITGILGSGTSTGAFNNCTGLKAVWLGDKVTSGYMGRYAFYRCSNLEKIYINLPRATVTTFSGYNYAFMNDTTKTGIIVCNDDTGWIDKATFDATNW